MLPTVAARAAHRLAPHNVHFEAPSGPAAGHSSDLGHAVGMSGTRPEAGLETPGRQYAKPRFLQAASRAWNDPGFLIPVDTVSVLSSVPPSIFRSTPLSVRYFSKS